ncbi:MAG: Citrate synthase [Chlamydiales bacterium]|nr:Citrate synthase [Chlamydiales bacterium]
MSEEILFEVTKSHLETGLRGIPVGYCTTSSVHPEQGLFYAGISVDKVADWEPERVIFLLYNGFDGSAQELESFKLDLKQRSKLSSGVIDSIQKLPRNGHPMALYSAAVLILGMYEQTGDYREDCLNLIAKLPEVTAAMINDHAGWGSFKPSDSQLGYMDNFSQMLGASARSEKLDAVLQLFNILHYDHGGGNLSAFVGKAVASGLEDLYGSIAAALNALAGPRHGRANQECLHFVEELVQTLGHEASEEDVEQLIRKKLANNELIYGFGHAVLRVEDPRATVQYQMAQKYYPENPLVKMAFMIRKMGTKVLKENPKIANPYPNVDAISGTLLTAAGFGFPEYYTVLFGLSRAVGISIQIVYERLLARGGKGTPIVRPKYFYKSRKEL